MKDDHDPIARILLSPPLQGPAVEQDQEVLQEAVRLVSPNGFRKLDAKLDPNSRVVFRAVRNEVAVEQYRSLRRNLTEQLPHGGILLVTSPASREGKTLNAINLALCLAEGTPRTLLLEADLRQPSVARVLGYTPLYGVESAMLGEVEPKSTVVVLGKDLPLYVAAAAKPQSDPIRALKSTATKNYLAWARSNFPWIVLDCPPVIPVADVAELAPLGDAVLLVVRARATPLNLVEKAFQILGNRVRGVILNEAPLSQATYYHYLTRDRANQR
jgi:Mrp family chromosome partitioning ATPase